MAEFVMASHSIGIKEAYGNIKPLFEAGETGTKLLTCTPASKNQAKAKLEFFVIDQQRGNSAHFLGAVFVKKLTADSQGDPAIRLSAAVESNGRLRLRSVSEQYHFSVILNAAGARKSSAPSKPPQEAQPETPPEELQETTTEQQQPAEKKFRPILIPAAIVYGLLIAALVTFLMTQTFDWFSLENLLGIKF